MHGKIINLGESLVMKQVKILANQLASLHCTLDNGEKIVNCAPISQNFPKYEQ